MFRHSMEAFGRQANRNPRLKSRVKKSRKTSTAHPTLRGGLLLGGLLLCGLLLCGLLHVRTTSEKLQSRFPFFEDLGRTTSDCNTFGRTTSGRTVSVRATERSTSGRSTSGRTVSVPDYSSGRTSYCRTTPLRTTSVRTISVRTPSVRTTSGRMTSGRITSGEKRNLDCLGIGKPEHFVAQRSDRRHFGTSRAVSSRHQLAPSA